MFWEKQKYGDSKRSVVAGGLQAREGWTDAAQTSLGASQPIRGQRSGRPCLPLGVITKTEGAEIRDPWRYYEKF